MGDSWQGYPAIIFNLSPDVKTGFIRIQNPDSLFVLTMLHRLQDQHGVAIGVKFVFVFYRFFVCFHYKVVPAEGANHYEQA